MLYCIRYRVWFRKQCRSIQSNTQRLIGRWSGNLNALLNLSLTWCVYHLRYRYTMSYMMYCPGILIDSMRINCYLRAQTAGRPAAWMELSIIRCVHEISWWSWSKCDSGFTQLFHFSWDFILPRQTLVALKVWFSVVDSTRTPDGPGRSLQVHCALQTQFKNEGTPENLNWHITGSRPGRADEQVEKDRGIEVRQDSGGVFVLWRRDMADFTV